MAIYITIPIIMNNHETTTGDLLNDLRGAGVMHGDILVVHSSLKSIGRVEGGAGAVVDALLGAVGENGTVLFPALPLVGSMTHFLAENPHVDLRSAPIAVGAIPNAAAVHVGAIRSNHPTHSVIAIGKLAGELTGGNQSGQGPLGDQSPFYLAAQNGAKILLIGVSNSRNTTIHCTEEIAAPYIHYKTFQTTLTDSAGLEHQFVIHSYPTDVGRDFDKIERRLLDEGVMEVKSLADAELRILDAKLLIEKVVQWIKDEPYLLTKQLPGG